MKIIVDNGGSKSDWVLVDSKIFFSRNGINLFSSEKEIRNQFQSIFLEFNINNMSIDFYTAGATESIKNKTLNIFKQYFPSIKISISSVSFFDAVIVAKLGLLGFPFSNSNITKQLIILTPLF